MITVKDHWTGHMFDPWENVGPKRKKLLKQSWAQVFRIYLLETLPVGKIMDKFSAETGRPSKELFSAVGALILQQLHNLSDPEVVHAFAFDLEWHYALDITDESDDSTYIAERTLRNYRRILIEKGLDKELFDTLTDTLIEVFGVGTSKQRLDSTTIMSNMRKLGRLGIFLSTIRKFLKKLKRSRSQLYESLIELSFAERYIGKKSEGCFSLVKPSEASKTLAGVGNDLLSLIECFKPYDSVTRLPEYGLLVRVLEEQCRVTGTGADARVEIKPPKEISPDSLQNPSDPDAGYDSHKGQGYKVQIMETYREKHDGQLTLDLITNVDVEPAHEHDANALTPAIEAVAERDISPDELLCDTLYGGDDNVLEAESNGVEVVAPVPGPAPAHDFTGFSYDTETMFITMCPAGHVPDRVKRTKKGGISARFSMKTCSGCPHLDRCPVKIGKKSAFVRYDDKILRLARRRQYEQTKEFKDRYRWRAGIEATNSHLKTDLGMGRLRVRGIRSVRFSVYLKALGLNILRCAKSLHGGFSPCCTQICALFTRFENRLHALFTGYHILLSKISCFRYSDAFMAG